MKRTKAPSIRIVYFHVPATFTAFTGFFVGTGRQRHVPGNRKLKYDAFAAAVTEVALAFATIVLVTGSIWARIIWGIWWAWDARLTSMLICWLIYAGYLMLRRAIDRTHPARAPFRRALDLGLRRRGHRLEIDRVVPHAASRAGAEHPRRRRHGARNGSAHLLELSGAGVPGGDPDHGAHAPGRVAREIDSLRRMAHSY